MADYVCPIRMARARFAFLALCFTISAVVPTASIGCTCLPTTLQRQYDGAKAIAIATVTGCAKGQPDRNGSCPGREWHFDVMEKFKGEPPHNTFGGMTSCDLGGAIGSTYLLFFDQDGNADLCGGSRALDDPNRSQPGASHISTVEMLRDYRDGRVADLSHPWNFSGDLAGRCAIHHSFDGLSIVFSYVYDGPQLVLHPGERITTPRLVMSLMHPSWYAAGATSFRVDGVDQPLQRVTRSTEIGHSPSSRRITITNDVAVGDTAQALFELMQRPVDVVVSGTRPHAGRSEWREFQSSTRTTRLASSGEKLVACMQAHSRAYCFNPEPGNDIKIPFCVPLPDDDVSSSRGAP